MAGLALILGVDRFLAEIRTATNFIGNGVAAVVISRWEGELDAGKLAVELGGRRPAPIDIPRSQERDETGWLAPVAPTDQTSTARRTAATMSSSEPVRSTGSGNVGGSYLKPAPV